MNTEINNKQKTLFELLCESEKFHLLFIIIFSVFMLFSKSWDNGLANYDDAIYAEKAKEILLSNSWWTMHMHNNPALDNPPFYMWITALSFKIWGINDYAARFPSQAFGVLTIVLVYFFAKEVFKDKWAGLFSAASLMTSYLWICYSRHCMLDTTLSFFCTLALFSLCKAIKNNNHKFFILWGMSISFCILTKSVLGFFPFIISWFYLIISGHIKYIWKSPLFILGCLEVFILGCSWYYHQYFLFREQFISVHFGWLILERGLTKANPKVNYFSYLQDLLIYYLPLIPVFLYGLYKAFSIIKKEKNNFITLFCIWIFLVFLVMSLMKTHSRWYVLSAYPAISIITGYGLANLLSNTHKILLVKTTTIILSLFILILNTTPINIEKQKDTDLRNMIAFMKTENLQNNIIIGYNIGFPDINCAIGWYMNRTTDKIFKENTEMEKFIKEKISKNKVFIIAYKGSLTDGQLKNIIYKPVYNSNKYILYKVLNSG